MPDNPRIEDFLDPAPAAPESTGAAPRARRSFDKTSPGGEWGAKRPYGGHTGADFPWKAGEGIGVARPGRVVFAGTRDGYGNRVEVEHDDGTRTTYSHLSRIEVNRDDDLDEGSLVGLVGNTGHSHGDHLHYEVLRGGRKVNPLGTDFVPVRGATQVRRRARNAPPSGAAAGFDPDILNFIDPPQTPADSAGTPGPSVTPPPAASGQPEGFTEPPAPPSTKKADVAPARWAESHASAVDAAAEDLVAGAMKDAAPERNLNPRARAVVESNLPSDLEERLPISSTDRVSRGDKPNTYRIVDANVEAEMQRRQRQADVLRRRIESRRREVEKLQKYAAAITEARRAEQQGWGQLSIGGLRERDDSIIEELTRKITSRGELLARDEQRLREAESQVGAVRGSNLAAVRTLGELRQSDDALIHAARERAVEGLGGEASVARLRSDFGAVGRGDEVEQRLAEETGRAVGALGNEEAATAAERERRARVDETGWGEYLAQAPKSAVLGLEGFGSSVLKGLGVLTAGPLGGLNPIGHAVERLRGTERADETLTYRAGQKLDEWAGWVVSTNPDIEQEFAVGQVPQAFGSMAGFLLGGWAMKAPTTAATVLGGMSGGAQVYDEVKELGGSEEEAQRAALVGMGLLGPLEIVPVSRMLNRLNAGAGGAGFRRAFKDLLIEAGEETVQEGTSEALTGAISGKARTARQILEAAAAGGVSGAGTSATISARNALRRAPADSEPAESGQDVVNAPTPVARNLTSNEVENQATSAAETLTPETRETIAAQIEALQAGRRSAVVVTPGAEMPEVPRGMKTVRTKEGTVIYDPNLAGKDHVRRAIREGRMGELMGHVEERPAEPAGVVVARDQETGREIQSSYVSSVEKAEEQAQAFAAQHPGAEVVAGGPELEREVLAGRQETNAQRAGSIPADEVGDTLPPDVPVDRNGEPIVWWNYQDEVEVKNEDGEIELAPREMVYRPKNWPAIDVERLAESREWATGGQEGDPEGYLDALLEEQAGRARAITNERAVIDAGLDPQTGKPFKDSKSRGEVTTAAQHRERAEKNLAGLIRDQEYQLEYARAILGDEAVDEVVRRMGEATPAPEAAPAAQNGRPRLDAERYALALSQNPDYIGLDEEDVSTPEGAFTIIEEEQRASVRELAKAEEQLAGKLPKRDREKLERRAEGLRGDIAANAEHAEELFGEEARDFIAKMADAPAHHSATQPRDDEGRFTIPDRDEAASLAKALRERLEGAPKEESARSVEDQDIVDAISGFQGFEERISDLAERGATDEELIGWLGEELGIEGGRRTRSGKDSWHHGGKNPRIAIAAEGHAHNKKPTYQGKGLAAQVRRIFGIGQPTEESKKAFVEQQKVRAAERRQRDLDGPRDSDERTGVRVRLLRAEGRPASLTEGELLTGTHGPARNSNGGLTYPVRVLFDDGKVEEFYPAMVEVLGSAPGKTDSKPEEKEHKHEFSSTQVNITGPAREKILRAAARIRDEDLYTAEPGYGREENPHITVKYGLHGDAVEAVRKVIAGRQPIKAIVNKTSLFESDNTPYDVVKLDVQAGGLREMNELIAGAVEHTDTHPTYIPHVTLAYVKKGRGRKYAGKGWVNGTLVDVTSVVFSDRDENQTEIKLTGKAEKQPRPKRVPVKRKADPAVDTLGKMVWASGGMRADADGTYRTELIRIAQVGRPGIYSKSGMSVEAMATHMAELGYPVAGDGQYSVRGGVAANNVDPHLFLQMVEDDLRGIRKVYSSANDVAQTEVDALTDEQKQELDAEMRYLADPRVVELLREVKDGHEDEGLREELNILAANYGLPDEAVEAHLDYARESGASGEGSREGGVESGEEDADVSFDFSDEEVEPASEAAPAAEEQPAKPSDEELAERIRRRLEAEARPQAEESFADKARRVLADENYETPDFGNNPSQEEKDLYSVWAMRNRLKDVANERDVREDLASGLFKRLPADVQVEFKRLADERTRRHGIAKENRRKYPDLFQMQKRSSFHGSYRQWEEMTDEERAEYLSPSIEPVGSHNGRPLYVVPAIEGRGSTGTANSAGAQLPDGAILVVVTKADQFYGSHRLFLMMEGHKEPEYVGSYRDGRWDGRYHEIRVPSIESKYGADGYAQIAAVSKNPPPFADVEGAVEEPKGPEVVASKVIKQKTNQRFGDTFRLSVVRNPQGELYSKVEHEVERQLDDRGNTYKAWVEVSTSDLEYERGLRVINEKAADFWREVKGSEGQGDLLAAAPEPVSEPANKISEKPTPDLSRAEQSGFGFGFEEEGLFAQGGPTATQKQDAPKEDPGARARRELRAKNLRKAFGEHAHELARLLESKNARARRLAEHLESRADSVVAREPDLDHILGPLSKLDHLLTQGGDAAVQDYLDQAHLMGAQKAERQPWDETRETVSRLTQQAEWLGKDAIDHLIVERAPRRSEKNNRGETAKPANEAAVEGRAPDAEQPSTDPKYDTDMPPAADWTDNPELRVEKRGKFGWSVKEVGGGSFPVLFDTKHEAVRMAAQNAVAVDMRNEVIDYFEAQRRYKAIEEGKFDAGYKAREEREAIKARLREIADEKKRRAGATEPGSELRHGGPELPTVEELTLMVRLARTYVQENVTRIREAWARFLDEFGEDGHLFRRAFEIGWEELRAESPEIDAAVDLSDAGEKKSRPVVFRKMDALGVGFTVIRANPDHPKAANISEAQLSEQAGATLADGDLFVVGNSLHRVKAVHGSGTQGSKPTARPEVIGSWDEKTGRFRYAHVQRERRYLPDSVLEVLEVFKSDKEGATWRAIEAELNQGRRVKPAEKQLGPAAHAMRLISALGLEERLQAGGDFREEYHLGYYSPLVVERKGDRLSMSSRDVGGARFKITPDGRLKVMWDDKSEALNERMASSVDKLLKAGFGDAVPAAEFKVDPDLEGLTPYQRGLVETADLDDRRVRLRHVPTGALEHYTDALKVLEERGLVAPADTFNGTRYLLTDKGMEIARRTQPAFVRERDEKIARNLAREAVSTERLPEVGDWVSGLIPGRRGIVFRVESVTEKAGQEYLSGVAEDGTVFEGEPRVFYAPLVNPPESFEAPQNLDAAEVGEENTDDAERSGDNLEPDSGERPAVGLREDVSDTRPGRDGGGARPRGGASGAQGYRPAGRDGVSGDGPAARGEGGDSPLLSEESAAPGGAAGDQLRGGGDSLFDAVAPSDDRAAEAVKEAAPRAKRLGDKRRAQAAANSLPVQVADLDNIRETLPFLLPEQQEDVHFAEQRFRKPDGYGVLFTNGTGTGKTYTGLGVARRYASQGKDNILIIAPSDKIGRDWMTAGQNLGLRINQLKDIQDDGGSGPAVTTYANFYQNDSLAKRKWDLVISDESHYLGSNKSGDLTNAAEMLRALTGHPEGVRRLARARNPQLYAELDHLSGLGLRKRSQEEERRLNDLYRQTAEVERAVRAEVAAVAPADRTRVLMLSATPFAYVKSVDLAQGYLFDWNDGSYGDPNQTTRGYNVPSPRQQFYVTHFGYRMRYNKLTEPDAKVNTDLMEQQFNEHLRKTGALRGRMLEVEADYERKFHVVHSRIGKQLDEGMDFLRNYKEDDGSTYGKRPFEPLMELLRKNFKYHDRMYLLEALKARDAVRVIRQDLKLGRKVVVFHDFNKGGGFHPFRFNKNALLEVFNPQTGLMELKSIAPLVERFESMRPDLLELDFDNLASPIETFEKEFGDRALFFNGTVSKGRRRKNADLFNQDGSGYDLIVCQSDAAREGISFHDTTGRHQRALHNLGMPVRPTAAIQIEGRIYRVAVVSDAIYRYYNTDTNFERWTFASIISQRSSTAENLAMGNDARALKEAFVDSFSDAQDYPASMDEGRGGKSKDRKARAEISPFERAKTYYYGQQKKTSKNKAAEGVDYFATPEPGGFKMVEWADIKPNDDTLEPSAGHGAVARFLPEYARRKMIEPSFELGTRAQLVSGAELITGYFEDHHLTNKYDAIVMNPPFGKGGKTAFDHLEKAIKHLRDGGRISALVPYSGTKPHHDRPMGMADKRWAAMQQSEAMRDMHVVADIKLPGVFFERAGTRVLSRILVLEKQTDPQRAAEIYTVERDLTPYEDINEVFDQLELITLPDRIPVPEKEEGAEAGAGEESAAASDTFGRDTFASPKYREVRYLASVEGEFTPAMKERAVRIAEAHDTGGSIYRHAKISGRDINGIAFSSAKKREKFIEEWERLGPLTEPEAAPDNTQPEEDADASYQAPAPPSSGGFISDRAGLIERIVAASRTPAPQFRESFETKGDDGHWYGMTFPMGVRMTDERRSKGFYATDRNGVSGGNSYASPEEGRREHEAREDRKAEEFRGQLMEMSDERLRDQASYWLKETPPAMATKPAAAKTATGGRFTLAETTHAKKGFRVYVATIKERVERDEYNRLNERAKAHGGWYSSFKGLGAVPGWQFKSEEKRAAFLREVEPAAGGDAGGSALTGSFIPTPEEAAQLKRKIMRQLKSLISGNTLASGMYPAHVVAELLPDLARLGAYHIDNGAREFKAFAGRMVDDLGEGITPHLRKIYNEAKKLIEGGHEQESEGVAPAGERGGRGNSTAQNAGRALAGRQSDGPRVVRAGDTFEHKGHTVTIASVPAYGEGVGVTTDGTRHSSWRWLSDAEKEYGVRLEAPPLTLEQIDRELAEHRETWQRLTSEKHKDRGYINAVEGWVERALYFREQVARGEEPDIRGEEAKHIIDDKKRERPRADAYLSGQKQASDFGGTAAAVKQRQPGVRSFPQTLEAADLEGGDDRTYQVFTNAAALEEADEIIAEKGLDGAIEFLRSSDDVGAEHVALAYRLLAQLDGERAVRVASDISRKLTRAGQAVQAAQIVSRLAPERVKVVAARIAEDAGTTLSAEQLDRITKLAEEAQQSAERLAALEEQIREVSERAEAERARAEENVSRLEEQIKNLRARLHQALEDEEDRDSLRRKINNLQAQLLRAREEKAEREGRRRRTKVGVRVGKLSDRLARMEAEARDRLAARKAAGLMTVETLIRNINEDEKGAVALTKGTSFVQVRRSSGDGKYYPVDAAGNWAEKGYATEAEARKRLDRNVERSPLFDLPVVVVENQRRDPAADIDTQAGVIHLRRRQSEGYLPSARAELIGHEEGHYAFSRLLTAEQREEVRRFWREHSELHWLAKEHLFEEEHAGSDDAAEEFFADAFGDRATGGEDYAGLLAHISDPIIEKARAVRQRRAGERGASALPLDFADWAIIGAAKVARGTLRFAEWSAEMVADVGAEVRPYLHALYVRSLEVLREDKEQLRRARLEREAVELAEDAGLDPDAFTPDELTHWLMEAEDARKERARAVQELARALAAVEQRGVLAKVGYVAMDMVAGLRDLQASGDLPPIARQGLAVSTLHPVEAAKAFVQGLASGVSRRKYEDVYAEIKRHPRFKQANRVGLFLAYREDEKREGLEGLANITRSEELFRSKIVGWVPWVKFSSRNFTAFMDWMRFHAYDAFATELESGGLSVDRDRKEFEDAAKFVNLITGRGTLGKKLDAAVPLLNIVLFAPKYLISRFEMAVLPLAFAPRARRIAYRKLALSFATTAGLVLFTAWALGLELEWDDPEDPDWLKLRQGHQHYDVFGGFQQPFRLLWRVYAGARKQDEGKRLSPGEEPDNILGTFVRQKLSPGASLAWDRLTYETMERDHDTGKKVPWQGWAHGVGSRLLPISPTDVYKSVRRHGAEGLKSLPTMIGVGYSDYLAVERVKLSPGAEKAFDLVRKTPYRGPDSLKIAGRERKLTQAETGRIEREVREEVNRRVEAMMSPTDDAGRRLLERFERADAEGKKNILNDIQGDVSRQVRERFMREYVKEHKKAIRRERDENRARAGRDAGAGVRPRP